MSTPRPLRSLAGPNHPAFFLSTAAVAQKPPAPLDSGLYTNYTIDSVLQDLTWILDHLIICGATQGTCGCYGSGSLGPFRKSGAMIEGYPGTQSNVVTRFLYYVRLRWRRTRAVLLGGRGKRRMGES